MGDELWKKDFANLRLHIISNDATIIYIQDSIHATEPIQPIVKIGPETLETLVEVKRDLFKNRYLCYKDVDC